MTKLRLALYQPEIPQNTGTLLRLGACLGVAIDIIEPCGFAFSQRRLKRAGLDYMACAHIERYEDWAAFFKATTQKGRRLIAVDPKGSSSLKDFSFHSQDVLLMGRESNGLPDFILQNTPHVLRIPMRPSFRSLNLAISAALIMGVALQQLDEFPDPEH